MNQNQQSIEYCRMIRCMSIYVASVDGTRLIWKIRQKPGFFFIKRPEVKKVILEILQRSPKTSGLGIRLLNLSYDFK